MTARWFDPGRLPVPPTGYARAANPSWGPMSGVELVLALLAGVVMGIALDRWLLRPSSTPGSTAFAGMGDERRDDAPERRPADVYSSARIGAAAALTLVLVVLLVLDVAVPEYDISPGILLPLLGAILALLGLEASAVWRGAR
jgi:hypothetical protein